MLSTLIEMSFHPHFHPLIVSFVPSVTQQATTGASPFDLVHGRLPLLPHESNVVAAWELRERQSPSVARQRRHNALLGARAVTSIPSNRWTHPPLSLTLVCAFDQVALC